MKRNQTMNKIIIQIGNNKEVFEMDPNETMIDSKEKRKQKAEHIKNIIKDISIENMTKIIKENQNKINERLARNALINEEKLKRKRKRKSNSKSKTNATDVEKDENERIQNEPYLRLTDKNFFFDFDDKKTKSKFKEKTKTIIEEEEEFFSSDSFFLNEGDEYFLDHLP